MVTNFIIWNDNHLTDNFRLLFDLLNDNPPESIKLKCYDDDRQGMPEKWVFEIVDKGYIDRADAILQTQITTNATNIQINASNINLANGRITQNSNDINALNLRVTNNENAINNLRLFKQHTLDKVFNIIRGLDYYRLHSYVTYVQNGAVIVKIEIDFYTENGINFEIDLKDVLPWIDVLSATPYNIENNPMCGHLIPREQMPNINDNYAIVFDRDAMRTNAFVDNDLGVINNIHSSPNMDEMSLKCSTHQVGQNANGRIFLTLACTY